MNAACFRVVDSKFILASLTFLFCISLQSISFAQDDDYTTPTIMPIKVIDGVYAERSASLELFGDDSSTLSDLINTIEKAKTDDEVGALGLQILRPVMGYAQATELRTKIVEFRESGKPIIAVMDIGDTKGYYIASAADHVVMSPVGTIFSTGLSLDLYFFKDMFEKLGMRFQAINTGRFKNALEPFTHQEMSDGTREQYGRLLEMISDEVVGAIAESRSMSSQEIEDRLFSGPHLSDKCLELGLITEVGYPIPTLDAYLDELNLEADWEYTAENKKRVPPPNIFTLFSGGASSRKKVSRQDKIAVIYALGSIIDGYAKEDPFSSTQVIASETFIKLLDEAVKENAKAIVIRVNSGGGSAVASDRIWNKLEEIKASGIPIVVSMGNVAASGGYYISMNSDRIFVQPTTITGSIGVISGRVNMLETYNNIGVNKQRITIGKNVWMTDETHEFTPKQIEFAEGLLESIYDDFTQKAADGRGVSQDRIKELGGGRVWMGTDAVDNGLADEIGGLESAISYAMAQLDNGDDLPVVTYPKEKSLTELLDDIMMGNIQVKSSSPEALVLKEWLGNDQLIRFLHLADITKQLMKNELQVLALDARLLSLQ